MDFFKSTKDKKLTVVADVALFLLSATAALLMCIETVPLLSVIMYVLLCALFAAVPVLSGGPVGCSVSATVTLAPAIVAGLAFVNYTPIVVTALLMVAGFLISFFHAKGAPRLYPVISTSLCVVAVISVSAVMLVSEAYGSFNFENVGKLFEDVDQAVIDGFAQLRNAVTELPSDAGAQLEAQLAIDPSVLRAFLFRFRITSMVSTLLSFCFFSSYLITALYRLLIKKACPELNDFPDSWRLMTPFSMRLMYVAFMLIGIFAVSGYTTPHDVNGFFPVFFVALFNIGELFGSVLLVEGIFALYDLSKAIREKSGKNYLPLAIIVIVAMFMFYPQIPILLLTWLGFAAGRVRVRRAEDNEGGE